jgi:hypothetical protein
MNLIRTIQRTEEPAWISDLFTPGSYSGSVTPLHPEQLPFPCCLKQNVAGGFAYIVYKRAVIAYGMIDRVTYRSSIMPVGSQAQPVNPGDTVVIQGTFAPMPGPLRQVPVRGFTGPRYTDQDLHQLTPSTLRTALTAAGIKVY